MDPKIRRIIAAKVCWNILHCEKLITTPYFKAK